MNPEGDEDNREKEGPRNEDQPQPEDEIDPPKDPLEAVDFMLEILETNQRGLVLMESIKPALLDNPDVVLKPATVATLNQAHGQVMEACTRYLNELKGLQKRLNRDDSAPTPSPPPKKVPKPDPRTPPPAGAEGGKSTSRPNESDPAGPEERRAYDGGD